jgi:transcriptional regulator with PAS, ATPase and Fis domain
MRETETKPFDPPSRRELRTVLRVAFSGGRVLTPPPVLGPTASATPVGREAPPPGRLDDARTSRHHATVHRDALGNLTVADERSKNGTFVNGERVQRQRLALGGDVSLGDSCLVACEDPSDAADAPVASLLGDSSAMRRVRTLVARLGPKSLTVLLSAESGCGKELVACGLHAASGRRGAFVPVNCAAIPENLFESQLFGHVAGAFTGAVAQAGFFRAADGGTLFLDEIGELPLALQPKLLRAVQERAVAPLGTTRPVACEVRIVAATNRDLRVEVERGRFRGDLLARLFEADVILPGGEKKIAPLI